MKDKIIDILKKNAVHKFVATTDPMGDSKVLSKDYPRVAVEIIEYLKSTGYYDQRG